MQRRDTGSGWMLVIALIAAALITGGFAGVFFGYQYYNGLCGTPCVDLGRLHGFDPEQGSILYDRDGNELGMLYRHHRRVIELSDMPQYLLQAFIDTEDRVFYEHEGMHYKRVVGAAVNNLVARRYAEGFSTITMQLARNLYPELLPATEKSPRRKLTEIRIARDIEREFGKNEILKAYLNTIYLGAGAYGVEAAAQTYFGKQASHLTLAEAALIAGLAKAPSDYNPYRNARKALERRNLVLRLMEKAGSISAEEASAARNEGVELAYTSVKEAHAAVQPPASHFIEEVRRVLDAQLGDLLYNGGLRIHTTLDTMAQSRVERVLRSQAAQIDSLAKLAARGDSAAPPIEGAMVVMDVNTGDVLAMVGGRDFMSSQFNRVTQARRQPGSVFKPFVYGAAIEAGCSPLDTVNNGYIKMLVGADEWAPTNFTSSEVEMGIAPITLHEALQFSENRATVRISQAVGVDSVVAFARRMGISTPLPHVPSVALGSANIRMLELLKSYSTFARDDGAHIEPRFVTRVEDAKGNVLIENKVRVDTVVSPAVTYVLRTILQDAVDNGTARSVRYAGYEGLAAGKTGTTDDAADVWFIGMTPHHVAGVWFGYDQPRSIRLPQRQATGGSLAAPVWAEVMKALTPQGVDSTQAFWSVPEGVDTLEMRVVIDALFEDAQVGSFLVQDDFAIADSNDTLSQLLGEDGKVAVASDSAHPTLHRQPRSICDVAFSPIFQDSLGVEYAWSYTLSQNHMLDSTKVALYPTLVDSIISTKSSAEPFVGDEMAEPTSILGGSASPNYN